MDWRSLNQHRGAAGAALYEAAICYAQALWLRGLSARALLAVDRALYADVSGNEPVLRTWPLPYAAVAWFVTHNPDGTFIGNPRVHYQHLADRVRGDRAEQKRWRAWACWHLVRAVAPGLPNDPRHPVVEPDAAAVSAGLETYGIPGETVHWQTVLDSLPRA